jgi:predicted RNA-binding Zn-ribbon protein involved in translation (DUF1610 family)
MPHQPHLIPHPSQPDGEAREAERTHYLEQLRQKLQDPEFRKIEGFPLGTDEDILALSDPPYYTACPNPFMGEILERWQAERAALRAQLGLPDDSGDNGNGAPAVYHREPFAADVSEGKNDPIYNAHSYHTKVPHKAIMRYILHYTDPGDIVFDGFCGTGMTGVAAYFCGDKAAVESLGYEVLGDGSIRSRDGRSCSRLGERCAMVSDLSPSATFIAYNYTHLSDLSSFRTEATKLVKTVQDSLGWLYRDETGSVLSAIWSDIFLCPNCSREFLFWDVAAKARQFQKSFACPHCGSIVGKSASRATGAAKLERPFEIRFDPVLGESVRLPKFALVRQIVRAGSKRVIADVSEESRQRFVEQFEEVIWPPVPRDKFMPGRQTNKLINGTGIVHVCHMYTPRALLVYARLWNEKLPSRKSTALFRFCLSSINNYVSRKQGYFGGGGGVAGTLFTPSIHLERNVFDVLLRKIDKVGSLKAIVGERISVSTQSVIDLRNVPGQSVDYIFTDPPFGESLQYAELNLFAESWLGVRTVVEDDCVLNYVHHKDLAFYSHMMVEAFRECARILKPGKWMTIEFHNSQNAVWNVIQRAIEISGLVVADVRILDKQQQSFNAVNRAGAVDQDLIISAYKPRAGFERRFLEQAGTEEGAWAFVRQHLEQLPVAVEKEGALEIVAERQAYLLYDRMVAFHIQRGCSVPLGAAEFYAGLKRRFPERDGMYFLRAQAAEYDRRRLKAGKVEQLALFVSDEKSAIQWLQRELNPNTGNGPQTYQDLVPKFMRELHQARHEKLPELSDILAQGFLKDDAERWYIPNPERQEDLEKLRERALLHEFLEYLPARSGGHAGRLKVFRTEAVRAGFKHSWAARDYSSIVRVAQRLPESVLQEDAGLLMYYDNALLRMEEQPVQGQLL